MTDNKIIDGKLVSSEIRKKIKNFADELKINTGKYLISCSSKEKPSK